MGPKTAIQYKRPQIVTKLCIWLYLGLIRTKKSFSTRGVAGAAVTWGVPLEALAEYWFCCVHCVPSTLIAPSCFFRLKNTKKNNLGFFRPRGWRPGSCFGINRQLNNQIFLGAIVSPPADRFSQRLPYRCLPNDGRIYGWPARDAVLLVCGIWFMSRQATSCPIHSAHPAGHDTATAGSTTGRMQTCLTRHMPQYLSAASFLTNQIPYLDSTSI